MESIIRHWLCHRDSEVDCIYFYRGIEGILELEETKIIEFLKYIKEVHSKRTGRDINVHYLHT